MNRIAKMTLTSVLLALTLGMVGMQSAGATTNVPDPTSDWDLTGYVYPSAPQFWCGNGEVGMYPVTLHAPPGFGALAALITFRSWRYTGPGNQWETEYAQSPNPEPYEPTMSPGGWASSSGGVWWRLQPGWSVLQPGWYYMQVEVQWWYYTNGRISRPFSKVYVLPTTAADYAASYHSQLYGHQVCYA